MKKEKKTKKVAEPVETPAPAAPVESAPINEVVVDLDASSLLKPC
jgi:hypothetical protein